MDFTLALPDWAIEENKRLPRHFPTIEQRMAAVIRFSRLNFEKAQAALLRLASLSATPASWW